MTLVKLHTTVNAPIERVFDLCRSIDLHQESTEGTNEEAIAGKTSGLITLNETVTWRAKHFGVYQHLTAKIISYERPYSFSDSMLKGTFHSMKHTHRFKTSGKKTIMTDEFEFLSPFGFIGRMFNYLFLKRYITTFLIKKNLKLKAVAESDAWKTFLLNADD